MSDVRGNYKRLPASKLKRHQRSLWSNTTYTTLLSCFLIHHLNCIFCKRQGISFQRSANGSKYNTFIWFTYLFISCVSNLMQHFLSKGVFILDLCSRRLLQSRYGKQSGRNYYFTQNCNCLCEIEIRHNTRGFFITDLLLCSVFQRFFITAVNILAYINTTSN